MLIMVPMSLLVNLTLQQDLMLNFFVFVKYLNVFFRMPLLIYLLQNTVITSNKILVWI